MMYERIMEAKKRKAMEEKNKMIDFNARSLYIKALANTNLMLREVLTTMYSNKYENRETLLDIYRPQDLTHFTGKINYNIDEQIACTCYNRINEENTIMYIKVMLNNEITFLPIVYKQLTNSLENNGVVIATSGNSLNFNFKNNREINTKSLRA